MFDIDNILGNKKSKKNKDPLRDLFGIKPSARAKPKNNIVKSDFMSLFLGQGNPRPDRKTPSQNRFLKRTRTGTGKSHKRFIDHDGDGVVSGLDCKPRNSRRHMDEAFYEKMQPYVNQPVRNGRGQCGEAAKCVVNEAIARNVPEDEIEVHGVALNHPFKEGHSLHIIAKVRDKYYDPTRTQYGKYDSVEHQELPAEYEKRNKMDLRNFVARQDEEKDEK